MCFLPLILVQQYALEPRMLLNTFSVFARRKMQKDRRQGREIDPVWIHFGYVYLVLIMVAAALGDADRRVFYVGCFTFAVLALFFGRRAGSQRPLAWGVSVCLAGVMGFLASIGIAQAYRYIETGSFLPSRARPFPEESVTAIGRVGKLKLSPEIKWRVRVEEGKVPSLMREAVFSEYGKGAWRHQPGNGLERDEDWENEMATRGDQGSEDYRLVFDRRDFDIDATGASKMIVTGPLNAVGPTPLLLPSGARLLRGLQADGVDFNSLGTAVVVNPDYTMTRFEVYSDEGTINEEDPFSSVDREVPVEELEVIQEVVRGLKLSGLSEKEVMIRLKQFFATFKYSLHQEVRADANDRGTMARFLKDVPGGRIGHCEYFATAATLILREVGIPARYAVGYAVKERNRDGEWLLRGRHGHAWCRVYVGGTFVESTTPDEESRWEGGSWIDFDPTPASWVLLEDHGLSLEQRLRDWFFVGRQNLQIWRNDANNRNRVTWAMGIVGGLVLLYVLIRLWQSRLRGRSPDQGSHRKRLRVADSPLVMMEKPVEAILGRRAPGVPLTEWLIGVSSLKPDLERSICQLVSFHWRLRFDPMGLEEWEKEEFRSLCRSVKKALK